MLYNVDSINVVHMHTCVQVAAMKGWAMPHTASTPSCRAVVPFKQNNRRRHAFPCEVGPEYSRKAFSSPFSVILSKSSKKVRFKRLCMLWL